MSDSLQITNDTIVAKTDAGTVNVSFKGSSSSVFIDDGKAPHYEKAVALPAYEQFFYKVKPGEKLRKGDLVIVKYSNGEGYMEMISTAKYDGNSPSVLEAISTQKKKKNDEEEPKPVPKDRRHLLTSSSFNAKSGSYTYNGVWVEQHPDGMTFTILRSKAAKNVDLKPANAEAERISKVMDKKADSLSSQDPDKKHGKTYKALLRGIFKKEKAEWEKKGGGKEHLDVVQKEREEYGNLTSEVRKLYDNGQSAEALSKLEQFNSKYAAKYPPEKRQQ